MSASFASIPSVVRFSPNSPYASGRPISCSHHRAPSTAYAYIALSGPPCASRSAWVSPSRFTPRAAIRPATGDFQMALLAGRPLYSNSRTVPTLTERTLAALVAIGSSPSRLLLRLHGNALAAHGEILWRFTKAGTFEFACLIPGRREAGMLGRVIVR